MGKLRRLVAENVNECVFGLGLIVVCASVAQWSRPLAGVIGGVVLMLVAVWPFLLMRKS